MSGGYYGDYPGENPVPVATNFSIPGPSTEQIALYRGPWIAGTLYNTNDMVVYTGPVDGVEMRLLLICQATHVAQSAWDATKWGTLTDLTGLTDSASMAEIEAAVGLAQDWAIKPTPVANGEPSAKTEANRATQQANAAAASAASAAAVMPGLSVAVAEQLAIAEQAAVAASESADAAEGYIENVEAQVVLAAAQATLSETAAELARLHAGAPYGTVVDPDTDSRSALHWAEEALRTAIQSIMQPVLPIDEPAGAGPWELVLAPAHIGRKLIFPVLTRPCTLRCPLNLHIQPWLDGTPSTAPIRVQAAATGELITIAAAAGGGTLSPSVIFDDLYQDAIAAGAAGDLVRTYRITVPAGVNRRLVIQTKSLHDVADPARNTRCSVVRVSPAAPVTIAKLGGDIGLAMNTSQAAASIATALFIGLLPDKAGGSPDEYDVTVTWSMNAFIFQSRSLVATNTSGHEGATVISDPTPADGFVDIVMTAAGTGRLAVVDSGQKGEFGVPTLSRGTVVRTGKGPDPLATGNRQLSFLHGREQLAAAGTNTWRSTYSVAKQGAGSGVLLVPAVGTSNVTVIAVNNTLTIPLRGQALIEALSDGQSFFVDAR